MSLNLREKCIHHLLETRDIKKIFEVSDDLLEEFEQIFENEYCYKCWCKSKTKMFNKKRLCYVCYVMLLKEIK